MEARNLGVKVGFGHVDDLARSIEAVGVAQYVAIPGAVPMIMVGFESSSCRTLGGEATS